jgi:hypothetical protein
MVSAEEPQIAGLPIRNPYICDLRFFGSGSEEPLYTNIAVLRWIKGLPFGGCGSSENRIQEPQMVHTGFAILGLRFLSGLFLGRLVARKA